ncbi:BREX-6 system BrxE protein [bacterium]|nr:MAG: BREX-6 system BrxE protein [bacterium]
MTNAPPADALDKILAYQFTVAWAGEGRSEPRRLGYWDTDLVDKEGGGDLLSRLLPRTHPWASLEAVREAARRVDAKARMKLAAPDQVRTLFFLGFQIDEALDDRIAALKRQEAAPADALAFPMRLDAAFSREALADKLRGGSESPKVVPGGRELKGAAPADAVKLIERLAAALVPFSEQYPMPFFRVAS